MIVGAHRSELLSSLNQMGRQTRHRGIRGPLLLEPVRNEATAVLPPPDEHVAPMIAENNIWLDFLQGGQLYEHIRRVYLRMDTEPHRHRADGLAGPYSGLFPDRALRIALGTVLSTEDLRVYSRIHRNRTKAKPVKRS